MHVRSGFALACYLLVLRPEQQFGIRVVQFGQVTRSRNTRRGMCPFFLLRPM
jgi:hypothetical protein